MRSSALPVCLCACLWLSACGGIAWNTTVAQERGTRLAMLQSVEIGRTTERQLVARWGAPTQKAEEGGQIEYIYRYIPNPTSYVPMMFGNTDGFVIVTFQYGKAVGARSSDTELCRASFPPRPPGHGFDNPTTVRPIGNCPTADGMTPAGIGMGSDPGGQTGSGAPYHRPTVASDAYDPAGSTAK